METRIVLAEKRHRARPAVGPRHQGCHGRGAPVQGGGGGQDHRLQPQRHGHFDLGAYDSYLSGMLEDFSYPRQKVEEALAQLPKMG